MTTATLSKTFARKHLAGLIMATAICGLTALASVAATAPAAPAIAAAPAAAAPTTAGFQEFAFHQTDVLGTSLDLTVVCGDKTQAEAALKTVLDEVERLRKILSTYDATSEISRAAASTTPMKASPELLEVLDAGEAWRTRTGGAFNAQLGDLVALWTDAAKADKLPDAAALADLAQRVAKPMWKLDRAAGTVARAEALKPDINAMAKGYILEKAAAAVKAKNPQIAGMLLMIGGDMRLVGTAGATEAATATPWTIGVVDPKRSADNAPPLVRIRVTDVGVATSGHYERNYSIQGKRYSHVFDARTAKPVEGILGATVVAKDAATADALSTTLCILKPEEGLALIKTVAGADCLIVAADGQRYASDGWKALEVPGSAKPEATPTPTKATSTATPTTATASGAWPAGYEAVVTLNLSARGKRPYVVVWIEDAAGKLVKSLAFWGNDKKYQKKMTVWWALGGSNTPLVSAITKATRPAGRYTLAWDGTDDAGKPVKTGTYGVRIETSQEDGAHLNLKGTIVCGSAPANATIAGNAHISEATAAYGPAAK
jgi:FAD:protein FMN transferase